MIHLGTQLKNIRLKKKITQEQIAQKLDITKGYISRLENNFIQPSLEKLLQILYFLKVNPSVFFSSLDIFPETSFFPQKKFFLKENNEQYLIKSVFSNKENKPSTFFLIIKPYQRIFLNLHQSHQFRFGFILEGELTFLNDKKKVILFAGDCFYFSPYEKYYFFNHLNKEIKLFLLLIS